jgi:hypothetical protein
LPIQSIPFPHSPSPLPSMSSILNGPIMSSSTIVHHDPPPRSQVHHPPEDHGESHGVPKFHKLSFPTYDGKEDLLGWLNRCESFFCGQLTREADKVWLASFHMTGSAQQWYYVLATGTTRRPCQPITWPISPVFHSAPPWMPTWTRSRHGWHTRAI